MSAWAKTPQTVAQDRDAACVPQGPQSLEHGGREHLGRVVEDRADRGLVRVEDRASRLGAASAARDAGRGSCGRSCAPC
jgi:hypothetical protein